MKRLGKVGSDSRYALREARAFQESLRELSGGRNPADRQTLKDIEAAIQEPIGSLVERVRVYLAVSVETQFDWRDDERAFKEWRAAVEAVGMYVFKRSFDQDNVSGFCVHDDEFPVIMINNSTSFTRQSFTLFHELGHLLYHVSGITVSDVARRYSVSREVILRRLLDEDLIDRQAYRMFAEEGNAPFAVEIERRPFLSSSDGNGAIGRTVSVQHRVLPS